MHSMIVITFRVIVEDEKKKRLLKLMSKSQNDIEIIKRTDFNEISLYQSYSFNMAMMDNNDENRSLIQSRII